MKLFRKRDILPVSILLVFSIISVSIFYTILKPKPNLPIYQPAQVNSKLVDSSIAHKIKYHTISDFSLINQNGDTITQDFYNNKIYVADFFFTTCQSICPVMTKNMKEIQDPLINDQEVLLLYHTVTPEIDSGEELKKLQEFQERQGFAQGGGIAVNTFNTDNSQTHNSNTNTTGDYNVEGSDSTAKILSRYDN